MTDSMSLITAQISFLDAQLVLVHIPIELYPLFLQPILKLLFGEDHDEDAAKIPWTNRHEFLNFSITPLECSIVCSKHLAQKYIVPVQHTIEDLFKSRYKSENTVSIFRESYIVIQVDGQGLDAGQRVLELTGPLAMAGISIFFITTYFCDYIIVPSKARRTVTLALEQRGFVFSKEDDAFVSQLSPTLQRTHSRHESSSSASSDNSPSSSERRLPRSVPSTPPAQDIDELRTRTFKKLKQYSIKPRVDDSLRLVSCAGSRESSQKDDERLKSDLLQVLISIPKGNSQEFKMPQTPESDTGPTDEIDLSPAFLSITITASEPISILLEERLLPQLGKALYGEKGAEDALVPITFDLKDLAYKTTGIVGGVAGRLSNYRGRQGSYVGEESISPTSGSVNGDNRITEISFLSTAKTGSVIVRASQVDKARAVLTLALEEANDDQHAF